MNLTTILQSDHNYFYLSDINDEEIILEKLVSFANDSKIGVISYDFPNDGEWGINKLSFTFFISRLIEYIFPTIMFKLEFDELNNRGYVIIQPSIRRIFHPHRISKKIKVNLTRKLHNKKGTLTIFEAHEIKDLLDQSLRVRINFLGENILRVNSKKEFKQALLDLNIKYTKFRAIQCVGPIFANKDYKNEADTIDIIEMLDHLFHIERYSKFQLQHSIHKAIKNLILENKGNLNVKINSHEDLIHFIGIMRSVNIFVRPELILDAIVHDKTIESMSFFLSRSPSQLRWDNRKLMRIVDIIGPYSNLDLNFIEDKIPDIKTRKEIVYSPDDVHLKINERDNSVKNIIDGHNERDATLAYLVKLRSNFKCEKCGSSQRIETSHKIPLYFGVKFGGIDHSINMEALCHNHHMEYEKEMENTIYKSDKIKTEDDLLDYLKNRFPEIFEVLNNNKKLFMIDE